MWSPTRSTARASSRWICGPRYPWTERPSPRRGPSTSIPTRNDGRPTTRTRCCSSAAWTDSRAVRCDPRSDAGAGGRRLQTGVGDERAGERLLQLPLTALVDELGLDVDVLLAGLGDHRVGDERSGDVSLRRARDRHVGPLLGLEGGDLVEELGRRRTALDQVDLLLDRDRRVGRPGEQLAQLLGGGDGGPLRARGGRGGGLTPAVLPASTGGE